MTNIEQKALELVNEMRVNPKYPYCRLGEVGSHLAIKALCRAIERHEAFRQEVSDALEKRGFYIDDRDLGRFIIPKPDPLVEVLYDIGYSKNADVADDFRAALAKRGGRIVFDD